MHSSAWNQEYTAVPGSVSLGETVINIRKFSKKNIDTLLSTYMEEGKLKDVMDKTWERPSNLPRRSLAA